jgi:hypothetical protein
MDKQEETAGAVVGSTTIVAGAIRCLFVGFLFHLFFG